MSTTDLYADLIRRAEACDVTEKRASDGAVAFAQGKAAAYRHAAELLRGAVAAAVEEERAACVAECADVIDRWELRAESGVYVEHTGDECALIASGAAAAGDAIRARGESPRGDAASDGREAP